MELGQIVLVVAAVMTGFFIKGITGIGAPLLVVPILAGTLGLEFAVTVVAIPTVVANTWLLWETRRSVREVAWFLWPLLVAGVFGTVFGAWVLLNIDTRVMTLALSAAVLSYIVWSLINRDFTLSETWAKRISAPAGFLGGILQGGTGASGPVIGTYVHALNLDRAAFILAVTIPFQILGVVQIVSLAAFGGYDRERLTVAAIATIPALVAMRPALKVGDRMSKGAFRLAVLVVLAAAAIRLIWTAL